MKLQSKWRERHELHLPSLMSALAVQWALVITLLALGWSSMFHLGVGPVLTLVVVILTGLAVGFYLLGGNLAQSSKSYALVTKEILGEPKVLTRTFQRCWNAWVAIAMLQFVIAGTPPLIRVALGQSAGHLTYGLPSIHGLLMAAGLALSLIEQTSRVSRGLVLIGPKTLTFIGWSLLIYSRKMIVVLVIQAALLLLASGKIRASLKQVVFAVSGAVSGIIAFGFLGAIRSPGQESIVDKYRFIGPEFIPDTFVWVISYITTPIANLANMYVLGYAGDSLVPVGNTFGGLLPRVLTGAEGGFQLRPGQLSAHFNVSTGFFGPMLDAGLFGVFSFALLVGTITGLFRRNANRMTHILCYLVCYQMVISLAFNNNFSNLNTVTQLPILLWLGAKAFESQHVEGLASGSVTRGRRTNILLA